MCNHVGLSKWLSLFLPPNCQNFTVENLPFSPLLQGVFPMPGLRALWVPWEVTHLYPLPLASADLEVGGKKGLGRRLVRTHQFWRAAVPFLPDYFASEAWSKCFPFSHPNFLCHLEWENESFSWPLVCYLLSFVCSRYCVGKLLLYCAPMRNWPLLRHFLHYVCWGEGRGLTWVTSHRKLHKYSELIA